MNNEMLRALNQQVNNELYSAYLYLSMASYFESTGLRGCANWMEIQAGEERDHAMKIYRYIHERRGVVTFAGIDAPKSVWKSPLAVFEEAFAHEQKVTKMIHDLVELATKHRDHATFSFLQWFVDEQVEEEANADEIVQKLQMVSGDSAALFAIDAYLGVRKAE